MSETFVDITELLLEHNYTQGVVVPLYMSWLEENNSSKWKLALNYGIESQLFSPYDIVSLRCINIVGTVRFLICSGMRMCLN